MGEKADKPATRAVRLRITGKVQGVWYRGWTMERAQELELDGWVRNRLDGSVEVLAVGASERIDVLIRACHKGPPAARVERVEVMPAQGITPKGFVQKPTV
jgi:acylphosphatase